MNTIQRKKRSGNVLHLKKPFKGFFSEKILIVFGIFDVNSHNIKLNANIRIVELTIEKLSARFSRYPVRLEFQSSQILKHAKMLEDALKNKKSQVN